MVHRGNEEEKERGGERERKDDDEREGEEKESEWHLRRIRDADPWTTLWRDK